MLGKLFGRGKEAGRLSQSQTLGNVTGAVQQVQAGRDAVATQTTQAAVQQQGLTGTEVVGLLERLKEAIAFSDLTAEQKEAVLDYLKPAQREAAKPEPDKALVGANLKQVSETMKMLKETSDAGKDIWQTGAEVFRAIAPWLTVTAAFFGL